MIRLLEEYFQGAYVGAVGFGDSVWCDFGGGEVAGPGCPHIFAYLVGITLFTDKSATAVDVVYLRYFRDIDIVAGYSWGAATLAHLYRDISKAARWNCGQVSGYLTLLQV